MTSTNKAHFDPVADSIADIPFFKKGSAGFIEKLAEKSRTLSVRKGQTLFVAEEEAGQFFLIIDGWIKLYRETLDGAQAVIDILNSGHVFGDTAIQNDGIYPFSAEAAEPSVVLALPLSLLQKEIEGNPGLAIDMLTRMVANNESKDRELEHRTLQNAPQRIGCFMLRLADIDKSGPVTIHLPYDKTLIAARLGMQPETFSRALKKLKEETGIQIKGATVEIDNIRQLSDFVCSACSAEFPCKDLASKKVNHNMN
jgi:CRP-like cAMP-binding protein